MGISGLYCYLQVLKLLPLSSSFWEKNRVWGYHAHLQSYARQDEFRALYNMSRTETQI